MSIAVRIPIGATTVRSVFHGSGSGRSAAERVINQAYADTCARTTAASRKHPRMLLFARAYALSKIFYRERVACARVHMRVRARACVCVKLRRRQQRESNCQQSANSRAPSPLA